LAQAACGLTHTLGDLGSKRGTGTGLRFMAVLAFLVPLAAAIAMDRKQFPAVEPPEHAGMDKIGEAPHITDATTATVINCQDCGTEAGWFGEPGQLTDGLKSTTWTNAGLPVDVEFDLSNYYQLEDIKIVNGKPSGAHRVAAYVWADPDWLRVADFDLDAGETRAIALHPVLCNRVRLEFTTFHGMGVNVSDVGFGGYHWKEVQGMPASWAAHSRDPAKDDISEVRAQNEKTHMDRDPKNCPVLNKFLHPTLQQVVTWAAWQPTCGCANVIKEVEVPSTRSFSIGGADAIKYIDEAHIQNLKDMIKRPHDANVSDTYGDEDHLHELHGEHMNLSKPELPDLDYINMSHPDTTPRAVSASDPMSILSPVSARGETREIDEDAMNRRKIDQVIADHLDEQTTDITVTPKPEAETVEVPNEKLEPPKEVVDADLSIAVAAEGTTSLLQVYDKADKPDPDASFVQSVMHARQSVTAVTGGGMKKIEDEVGTTVDVRMVCAALSCLAGAMAGEATLCVDILSPICEKLKEKSQCHAECDGYAKSQCVDVTVGKDEKAPRKNQKWEPKKEEEETAMNTNEKAFIQLDADALDNSKDIEAAIKKQMEREHIRELEDEHSFKLLKQLRSQET